MQLTPALFLRGLGCLRIDYLIEVYPAVPLGSGAIPPVNWREIDKG
jgi:hypothetical protein